MTRSLLITGGAGFIAGNLVHHWAASHPDDRLVVLDALTYACLLYTSDAADEKRGVKLGGSRNEKKKK